MPKSPKPPSEAAYEVGYGKPPKATRFKPGRSGNPKGRPKGSKSLPALIERELDRRADVKVDGRSRRLAKREILARQVVDAAARGDLRALTALFKLTGAAARDVAVGAGGAPGAAQDIPEEAYEEMVHAYLAEITPPAAQESER